VARAGNTDTELKVLYTISGSANENKDYKKLAGSVVIPIGEESVLIEIVPLLKGKVNMGTKRSAEDQSVVITLSGTDDYKIGCPISAMVVIKEH
jgi:hypothetical protein